MDVDWKLFSLGKGARFAAAAACYAAGALLGFGFGAVLPGWIVIAAGWIPLALKPITNKPSDKGLEEWRPVSSAEIDRIADAISRSGKTARSSAGRLALAILATVGLSLLAVAGGLSLGSAFAVACVDAFLFLVPALYFGRVKVFVPKELSLKIRCMLALLSVKYPEGIVLTPYLRFDKDAKGLDVPEDMRVMLEPRRKPADLVGVQLQASINNGANGEVPYLYAVFLFKGAQGAGFRAMSRARLSGFVVEANGEGEYGTVVVRQDTDNGGYHTTPDDCVNLAETAVRTLEKLSAA